MKKNLMTLLALIFIFFAGTSCEKKMDIEKEKAAIKAVIEEDANSYYDRDFDRFTANYVQDETSIRLTAHKLNYVYYDGWDELSSAYSEVFKNDSDPVKNNEANSNYRIKVYDDAAWAVFDINESFNKGELVVKTIGVNFLEKVDGKWKIVYLSRVGVSSYEEETLEVAVEQGT